jgi:hypothetical protein
VLRSAVLNKLDDDEAKALAAFGAKRLRLCLQPPEMPARGCLGTSAGLQRQPTTAPPAALRWPSLEAFEGDGGAVVLPSLSAEELPDDMDWLGRAFPPSHNNWQAGL